MPPSYTQDSGSPEPFAGATSAKTVPPRLRSNRVRRLRLIERLGPDSHENIVVVSAPAGYGKTTLLAEWASREAGPVAWVSLDESDNDSAVFWSFMGQSLAESACGVTQHGIGALNSIGEISTEYALAPLLSELAHVPRVTIFLDDYQSIFNHSIHDSLHFLIEHLPQSVRMVVGARVDPPFPLSRWRAKGRLLEIRATGLAFNEAEAATLIGAGTGVALPDPMLKRVVKQTDGWAMGLRAAAIAINHSSDPDVQAAEVAHIGTHMPEYIRQEVFNKQPDGVKEFLVKTSILETLNPDLCDHVLQSTESRKSLDLLERADVFVSALDGAHEWYRVHPLLGQMLRSLFTELEPEEKLALHRRASEWLAVHGQREAAIRHALDGEDWGGAVRQMAQLGQYMVPTNRPETMKHWLSRIPRQSLEQDPYACVQLARAMMFGNLFSDFESLLRIAEVAVEETNDPILNASMLSVRCQARCFEGRQQEAISMAQKGIERLPDAELLNRGLLWQLQSVCYMLSDRLPEAESATMQSFEKSISSGNAITACLALGMRAFINLRRARLGFAYRYVGQAESLAQSSGIGTLYLLPFHRSRIDMDSLQLEAAESALRQAEDRFEKTGYRVFTSSVHLNMARLKWMRGLYDEAEECLLISEEAQRSTGGIQDVVSAQSLRVRMHLEREDWDALARSAEEPSAEAGIESKAMWIRAKGSLALVHGRQSECKTAIDELTALARTSAANGLGADAAACYVGAGALLERLGMRPKAVGAIDSAIAICAPGELYGPFWDVRFALAELIEDLRSKHTESAYIETLLRLLHRPASENASTHSGLLSSRELEILQLLTQGYGNESIADMAAVSRNTVKTHLKHIYLKLGARNRTEAVATARDWGIIP